LPLLNALVKLEPNSKFPFIQTLAVRGSKACASKLGRFLPMLPMFSFVRIRDIAANPRIIVDEHTAYAQSYLVVNASDNCALAVALVTRGVS
jgi:hypothetical protein